MLFGGMHYLGSNSEDYTIVVTYTDKEQNYTEALVPGSLKEFEFNMKLI